MSAPGVPFGTRRMRSPSKRALSSSYRSSSAPSPSSSAVFFSSLRTNHTFRRLGLPLRPEICPCYADGRSDPVPKHSRNGIVTLAKNSGFLEGSSTTLELSKPLIFQSAADDRFARLTRKSRQRDNARATPEDGGRQVPVYPPRNCRHSLSLRRSRGQWAGLRSMELGKCRKTF